MDYHQPVLLTESVEALQIVADGVYVDATYGGGGHSRLIVQQLGANGHLYSFDQDEDVMPNLITENERFTYIHQNFRFLKSFLRLHGAGQVFGILADLGVSSHQFDDAQRGFSYRFEADLDMRMNREGERTATDILRTYSAEALQSLFSRYGEVRNAKTLAQAIVAERERRAIRSTTDFMLLLDPLVRGNRNRYLAQVFQALRIEVNDEMGALESFLAEAREVLRPGGRLVVIAYHSLEDRLVINFFKTGNTAGEVIKDFYGNIERPFRILTKKAQLASPEELRRNPRARSAKLRYAEKIN